MATIENKQNFNENIGSICLKMHKDDIVTLEIKRTTGEIELYALNRLE